MTELAQAKPRPRDNAFQNRPILNSNFSRVKIGWGRGAGVGSRYSR